MDDIYDLIEDDKLQEAEDHIQTLENIVKLS